MNTMRTEEDFFELMQNVRAFACITSWAQLGLFRMLEDSPKELSSLPGDHRALRISARVLAHLGLLITDGTLIGLSPTARTMLAKGELEVGSALTTLDDLTQFPRILVEGGCAKTKDGMSKATSIGIREDQENETKSFLRTLYRRCEHTAEEAVFWVKSHLREEGSVLDLGGGHGRYALAFANQGFHATLFDKKLCIDIAKELCAPHERLSYREGDFHQDDLGGPYDAVFLSNIVHGLSASENEALFQRIGQCLNRDGILILKDMYLDEFGSGPQHAIMFAVTMLLYTNAGETYSVARVNQWLKNTGFSEAKIIALSGYTLLVATKSS